MANESCPICGSAQHALHEPGCRIGIRAAMEYAQAIEKDPSVFALAPAALANLARQFLYLSGAI